LRSWLLQTLLISRHGRVISSLIKRAGVAPSERPPRRHLIDAVRLSGVLRRFQTAGCLLAGKLFVVGRAGLASLALRHDVPARITHEGPLGQIRDSERM